MYRFTTTMMIFVLGLGYQLANAASPGDVPSATVHFADLDLLHSQGVTVLYRRLKDAAETVCAAQNGRDLGSQMRFKACWQAALSTAVTKVDQPALTAYYQAQFNGRNGTGGAGSTAVFILPPSNFDPSPGFPEAQAVISAVTRALRASTPARVVCLSTIGAQAPQLNLLTQRTLMEQALSTASCPVTFLRPAWFIENSQWDIARAKEVLSRLLGRPVRAIRGNTNAPMIAIAEKSRERVANSDVGFE
jgi:UrcA family protein